MKELADALKSVFDKLGQFLDLFDLSFLISGAVTTGAVAFWCHKSGYSLSFQLEGWLFVFALVLAFYIAGLVNFALGRWPRTGAKSNKSFEPLFERILKAHGLNDDPTFKDYLQRTAERGAWRLYVRLWAEVRACPSAAPSLSLKYSDKYSDRHVTGTLNPLTPSVRVGSRHRRWTGCRRRKI